MEVIKEWENDDFTNTDIFANYLIVNFLDANGFYDKNSMLDKFKKDRANYINPKIKLNSVIS